MIGIPILTEIVNRIRTKVIANYSSNLKIKGQTKRACHLTPIELII